MIGSTTLKVIRVEAEDDGSFTAVTDHWPDREPGTWRKARPLSELLDDKSKNQLKMILGEEPDANMSDGNPADHGD